MTQITSETTEIASKTTHVRAARSCSIWYFVTALAFGGLGVIGLVMEDLVLGEGLAVVAVLFAVAFIHFIVGWGLLKLRSWARIPTAVISGIGLIGFPIGTVIHGYILLTVFSHKSKTLYS